MGAAACFDDDVHFNKCFQLYKKCCGDAALVRSELAVEQTGMIRAIVDEENIF